MTSYAHHFEGKSYRILAVLTPSLHDNPCVLTVIGMSWEDSKPLFDKLWAHLTQDKYILTVYWENNGDIVSRRRAQLNHSVTQRNPDSLNYQVMWDNTAVLHRATSTGSYAEKYVRDMRRTTTKDDSSFRFGENEDHSWEAGISKVKT